LKQKWAGHVCLEENAEENINKVHLKQKRIGNRIFDAKGDKLAYFGFNLYLESHCVLVLFSSKHMDDWC